MRFLLPFLALLLAGGPPATMVLPVAAQETRGIVARIMAGDTLGVGLEKVRVLGIITPAAAKPGTPPQCGEQEATAFAKQLLDGRSVTLVADPTQGLSDRYGRSLRYVRLDDGRDYGTEIVRAGLARVHAPRGRRVTEYPQLEQAQTEAVAAKRGLWGLCPGLAPGD